MWESVVKFIHDNDRFLLTTHINPEGDAIGSEVALKLFLEDQGKGVFIVNSSPTPMNCRFLDPKGEILIYPQSYDSKIMDSLGGIIILDVNGWIHLGPFARELKKTSKPSICIDHHEGFENDFVKMQVSDTSAASTGVLVYELIKFMGGKITRPIAEAVYASLITDTGNFRFTNTNERAFRVASELLSVGIDSFRIHRLFFANRSWGAAKLIAPVMNTLKSDADGKLAWIYMTAAMRKDVLAEYEDSDGLLDLVRAIKSVELCFFFKETDEGEIKISVRSNGRIDAYRIARKYGGGGHRMASGMVLRGPMNEVMDKVIRETMALEMDV